MTNDPKVQRIVEWRETFETLPDDYFFELIRMYLGEVKTPYNKHKLIEELAGFLRKEENKAQLVKLLGDDDLKIISAVKFMPGSTQEKLSKFFASTFSVAVFYERLENLQERLILYTRKDKKEDKEVVDINPMLDDVLEPFLNASVLLPENIFAEKIDSAARTISPEFITSYISYVLSHEDLCKGDGSFKKKTLQELEEIYGDCGEELQLLTKAFFNLNLFHHDEKTVTVDWDRLKNFSLLNTAFQYSYICVAATIHLSRKTLQSNTQLFIDTMFSISETGYTREEILRLSLMLKEQNGGEESFTQSRFSRILAQAESGDDDSSFADGGMADGSLMGSFLDSALVFGLAYQCGTNIEGEAVYKLSDSYAKTLNAGISREKPKVLNIDSGYTITLMPGLLLKDLISLVKFLDIIRYDTAAVYEINRHSVMRSFDAGCNPEQLFEILNTFSMYPLPQNLQVSVEEWYHSYSSATLYHGYVLRVSEDNAVFAQKNPVLSRYIKEVLAPGILLLNFHSDDEAKTIIIKSGLDFIGEVHTASNEAAPIPLPPLRAAIRNPFAKKNSAESKFERGTIQEQKELIASYRNVLNEIDATSDQKEGLMDRISRKIIVNPVQLRAGSVRFERLEALGIDYTGKLHVIDNAIQTNSMLEIETEDSKELLIGTPVSLNKKTGDAEVVMDLEPDHMHKIVSVSAAVRIKKIRTRHISFI